MHAGCLALLVGASALAAPAAEHYYLAPDGNDQWSGRLAQPNAARTDGPFATPQRARDAVRQRRRAGTRPDRSME